MYTLFFYRLRQGRIIIINNPNRSIFQWHSRQAFRDAIIITRDATTSDISTKMYQENRPARSDILRPAILSRIDSAQMEFLEIRLQLTSLFSFHSHLDTTQDTKIRSRLERDNLWSRYLLGRIYFWDRYFPRKIVLRTFGKRAFCPLFPTRESWYWLQANTRYGVFREYGNSRFAEWISLTYLLARL